MRRGALPGFPIQRFRREIEGRRIFPRSGGIVAAEGAFDHHEVADRALRDEFLGFGAEHRTDALRTDLDDAPGGFPGFDHFETIGRRVRHRFFAVDIFSGVDGVDDDLLVPMIGNGGDQAIDLFVVEQIFVAAGDEKIGIAGNFARERVAAIVEIGGGNALSAGERHGGSEQARSLHADADDAETQTITGRHRGVTGGFQPRVAKQKRVGRGESTSRASGFLQEFAA